MIQYVFIIGATGKVGKTLVRQIFECKDTDFSVHTNPRVVVGLASSDKFLFSKDGLTKNECMKFINKELEGKKYNHLDDIYVEVRKSGYGFERKLVFIDVTASADIIKFHLKICEDDMFSIVTTNKNPLALCEYKTFIKLTSDVKRYGYRCSVMAGAEAVSLLQDLYDVNDPPILVFGCFSGTLGYICTELEKGRMISEIISEAKKLGYTEPHPRDDLSGLDVARKLLILARTSGYNISLEDINVSSFIPSEYLKEDDVEKFMESLNALDKIFKEKVGLAKNKGKVLRYVARMEVKDKIPALSVCLEEVEKQGSLGMLAGTSNKITVVSKVYPEKSPYIVEAPGAGLDITAQNIRRDLLYQLEGRKSYK